MSFIRLLAKALFVLLGGCLSMPAQASTILYRTDAQLIAGSHRVVHARVIGKRATRGGPNQSIYTVTTLQVIEDFTGVAGDIIETWELGGVLGNQFLYVGGSVEYQVGQEVVVCLERGSLGYRSVAMGFSKFDVEPATGALRRNVGAAVVVGGALSLRERNFAEFRELARQTTGREPVAGVLSAAAPVAVESDPFTLLGTGWRWPVVDAGTPIRWFKNTTAAPPITTGDGVPEILATMSAWTTPPTARITLTYGGATSQTLAKGPFTGLPVDSSGVITFEDPGNEISGFTIAIGGGAGFLGSGATVNGHTFNEFTTGFVIFQNSADLAAIDPPLLDPVNFARILEHEVGHAIGLGHTPTDGSVTNADTNIMFPFCCDTTTPVPPALGANDVAGLTFIYPVPAPPACTYSLSPLSSEPTSAAGGGIANVTTGSGCSWTAVSNSPSFLTITLGGGGSGPGVVNYGLTQNTSSVPRTGTMTIAGQIFVVYQGPNATAPCTYAINPTAATVGAAAGGGALTVTARDGCAWTTTSNSSFLTVTTGAGTGTGPVVYAVTANGAFTRAATLTIGGQVFTLTQLGAGASVSLDKPSLNFAAALSGPTVTAQTSPQSIRLSQSAGPAVSWTATSNQPWLVVSPTSGTGDRDLTVSVNPAGFAIPAPLTGQISVTLNGAAHTVEPVAVNLSTYHAGTTVNPIGLVDTPADRSTGVTGSIAFTGWALDDIEVENVYICRAAVANEPAPIDQRCAGNAQIFVGGGVFIEGARPDVQTAAPSYPRSYQAGWGFMVLTNLLPNQGNGVFLFHVYAVDREGQFRVLGSRTLTCDNANGIVPFGTIDTPGQGDTVSGNQFVNFGWALAPRPSDPMIPVDGSTINVFVDGVALGTVDYGHARNDIITLFPGYQNTNGAVGFRIIDTTLLTNGLHTIVWNATDGLGRTGGLGSRFFRVANSGASLTHADARLTAVSAAEIAKLPPAATPIAVKRGWDDMAPWRSFVTTTGRPVVRGEELDRFEFEFGGSAGDAYAGFLRVGSKFAPLPVGSRLDGRRFIWAPGLGFIGAYDLVFVRLTGNVPVSRQDVQVVLHAKGSGHTGPQVVIDLPTAQQEIDGSFVVAGWGLDLGAVQGTGVEFLQVWAYPLGSEGAFFIGAPAYGGRRPDVAAVHGDQFVESGFGLAVSGLLPGTYDLAVFAWSNVADDYVPARVVRVTVK